MILGINMAVSPFSIGLWKSNHELSELTKPKEHWDLESLIDALAAFLTSHNHTWPDISAISIATGPGSYTSLRLGITTIKTIAKFHHIPVYPISTLEGIMQTTESASGVYISVIPGRKQDINAALFTAHDGQLTRQSSDFVWAKDQLFTYLDRCDEPITLLGIIPEDIQERAHSYPLVTLKPRPLLGSTLALQLAQQLPNDPPSLDQLVPHYSHEPMIGPSA